MSNESIHQVEKHATVTHNGSCHETRRALHQVTKETIFFSDGKAHKPHRKQDTNLLSVLALSTNSYIILSLAEKSQRSRT